MPYPGPRVSTVILMYDDVPNSLSPDGAILEFLQSTYEAGPALAGWDHAAPAQPHLQGVLTTPPQQR